MGENKHIEELDDFAKKYIKEIKQEQPSFGFTASIMQTIAEENIVKNKVLSATPLISKKGWTLIFVLIAGMLFISFLEVKKGVSQTIKFDFTFLNKVQIPNFFDSFYVSNTVLYLVLLFALLAMIQIVFLKKYFERRWH